MKAKQVVKTLYIADDGKEFENRIECLDYEYSLKYSNYHLSLHLLDEFEMTAEHVELLRMTNWSWSFGQGFGAHGRVVQDGIRPFVKQKNDEWYHIVGRIFNINFEDEYEFDENMFEAWKRRIELILCVQIVMDMGSFEPGAYMKKNKLWQKK